jgi:hypothetical protein
MGIIALKRDAAAAHKWQSWGNTRKLPASRPSGLSLAPPSSRRGTLTRQTGWSWDNSHDGRQASLVLMAQDGAWRANLRCGLDGEPAMAYIARAFP